MAKALYGYVGTYDPATAAEITALRRRIDQLEATVLRLRSDNDRLAAAADEAPLTVGSIIDVREPVLA